MHARKDQIHNRNIMSKTVPQQAYNVMPSQSVGPNGNDGAMRPNFNFMPYDQQRVDTVVYQDKQQWIAQNPKVEPCRYPGAADPQGRSVLVGAGNCDVEKGCQGGRVWVDKSGQCECPYGQYANNKTEPCRTQPVKRDNVPTYQDLHN